MKRVVDFLRDMICNCILASYLTSACFWAKGHFVVVMHAFSSVDVLSNIVCNRQTESRERISREKEREKYMNAYTTDNLHHMSWYWFNLREGKDSIYSNLMKKTMHVFASKERWLKESFKMTIYKKDSWDVCVCLVLWWYVSSILLVSDMTWTLSSSRKCYEDQINT